MDHLVKLVANIFSENIFLRLQIEQKFVLQDRKRKCFHSWSQYFLVFHMCKLCLTKAHHLKATQLTISYA